MCVSLIIWRKSSPTMIITHITGFIGQTWGPPGSCRPQMGPMLAPWTLLSGHLYRSHVHLQLYFLLFICMFEPKTILHLHFHISAITGMDAFPRAPGGQLHFQSANNIESLAASLLIRYCCNQLHIVKPSGFIILLDRKMNHGKSI